MNREIVSSKIVLALIVVLILTTLQFQSGNSASADKNTGDERDGSMFTGYTLFTPTGFNITYLINNDGEIIHTWPSEFEPAFSVYLLEDGSIMRSTQIEGIHLPGRGGAVQRIDWDGTSLWYYEYHAEDYIQHHDIEPLPNGNVLLLAMDRLPYDDAITAGRNPELISGDYLKLEHIVEVQPTSPTNGTIIWQWYAKDHLIQDYDPTKGNYGVVEDHPELIDFNFVPEFKTDWLHANTVTYNEEFDQIMITCRHLSEIWVIDHSTTTEEAAGHTGGRYGKGGDLLYRWGNPQSYRAGDEEDQILYGPHDGQWIHPGFPGEGNILIFNNGFRRPSPEYSSVIELIPPVDENGTYTLPPGAAYEPEEPHWEYTDVYPPNFFASSMSGCQRLPTGNTLICHGPKGYFFEVTPEKEMTWNYTNLFPTPDSPNNVFKVRRYYEPYIAPIPTLSTYEDELYILDLTPFILDPDTLHESLILTEDSSYADINGRNLHLLYPSDVITDDFNLSVNDGVFTSSQRIYVDVLDCIFDPPEKPWGPQRGSKGRLYHFCTTGSYAGLDEVFYKFSWGDGAFSEWLGPYESGEFVQASHIWSSGGRYQLQVKIKDAYGDRSNWSEAHSICIFERIQGPILPPIQGQTEFHELE